MFYECLECFEWDPLKYYKRSLYLLDIKEDLLEIQKCRILPPLLGIQICVLSLTNLMFTKTIFQTGKYTQS